MLGFSSKTSKKWRAVDGVSRPLFPRCSLPKKAFHCLFKTVQDDRGDCINVFRTFTHFDIGFQLTQFPGKMAMEPKGEMVGALEDVLTSGLCTSAELATASHAAQWLKVVECLGEGIMKDHKPKRGEWSHSLIKRSDCRYTNGRLHSLPLQRFSFVGQGSSLEALPPCGLLLVERTLRNRG